MDGEIYYRVRKSAPMAGTNQRTCPESLNQRAGVPIATNSTAMQKPNRLDPHYRLTSLVNGEGLQVSAYRKMMKDQMHSPYKSTQRTVRIRCCEIAALLLVIAVMSACGVTLSPVKRAPVQIATLETSLRPNGQTVLFRFDSIIPGKPLVETVWDNASGAFADARESQQIGFTQNYSTLIPATVVGGPVGAAIVGTQPSYTRIVIPFGRIFGGVFQSGLEKVFPKSSVCFDDPCESENLRSRAPKYVVRVKVVEFQVWEKPLNHINMKSLVTCNVHRAGTTEPANGYEARHEVLNQSIGSIMTTSSGFISEMNKVSNAFAAVLSEHILANLQRDLSD